MKTPTRGQHGFTLLELLVVMTLLSLLMTGMVSALRTMAQTESRIDQRFERLDELRTAHAFLLQSLSRQPVAKIDIPNNPGQTKIPFVATNDSVTWVGILPARPNVGGMHYFRLTVEHTATGNALVLRIAPCDVGFTQPNWPAAEHYLLVKNIAGLTIHARGLPQQNHGSETIWPTGWQSGWPLADAYPEQLRLSLEDDSHTELLQWTFALRTMLQNDDTVSVLTFGGGRR